MHKVKYIVGHYVATDGEWPDTLGKLDNTISVVPYRNDHQLMWFPDGIIIEMEEWFAIL